MRSSPCIRTPPQSLQGGPGARSDCRSFLGDIDPDRAPGDAATTADATGAAELIDPVGQLVSHPLAVARSGRLPHAAAVNVGKIQGKTGIPATHALGNGA